MINIENNGKEYSINSELSEITIKDFEIITGIFNDETKLYIDKWSEIFVILGIEQDIVDNFDTFEFINIIERLNIVELYPKDIEKQLIINGDIYQAFDDKFKITVKDMSLIEFYVKNNGKRYLGEIMAVVYKRPGFDKTINYDKAHIHHKAELFRKELTADKAIPFIAFLSSKLVKDFELLNNE